MAGSKRMMFALAMGAIALVSGCSASSGPTDKPTAVDTGKVADEVKAAIKWQVDAYAARDPVKAASIMAPDLLGMFHGEANKIGKEAGEAAMKAQMTLPDMTLAVSNETVDVASSGDLAVYHAIYRFTFTNPETKQPFVESGNWVAVFTRQPDGTMKMTKDIVADTP